jgi:hypothetical protein
MVYLAPSAPVLTTVTFSRTMFAQLQGQKFHAPKPFLASPFQQVLKKPGSKEFKWAENGIKLSCGLEMLLSDNLFSETHSQHSARAVSIRIK